MTMDTCVDNWTRVLTMDTCVDMQPSMGEDGRKWKVNFAAPWAWGLYLTGREVFVLQLREPCGRVMTWFDGRTCQT